MDEVERGIDETLFSEGFVEKKKFKKIVVQSLTSEGLYEGTATRDIIEMSLLARN